MENLPSERPSLCFIRSRWLVFLQGVQWSSLRSVISSVGPVTLETQLRKDDKEGRLDVQIILQNVFTAVFTLDCIHYQHWFTSHHDFFSERQDTGKRSRVTTLTEASTLLYLCVKFSTFPGTCFNTQTSKSTWKGRDICPNPTSTPHLHRGKWSNVVHIIW